MCVRKLGILMESHIVTNSHFFSRLYDRVYDTIRYIYVRSKAEEMACVV